MTKFDYAALIDEIKCINNAWGYDGVLDALRYMMANESEYKGTRVGRELKAFMVDLIQPDD